MSRPEKSSITCWEETTEILERSQYGSVTYLDWCRKEAARINLKRGHNKAFCDVIQDPDEPTSWCAVRYAGSGR